MAGYSVMARHQRVQFPGAIYHTTVRGNARAMIFTDSRERQRLVDRLAERVETFSIRLYLFVLMPNHFHLVFETPRANLCRFMQSLLTAYATFFNLRHDRHGHVTEGRYGAKLVEGDDYLLKLTRYVHLNPVFTKQTENLPLKERVRILREYPWSSYPSYIGQREPLDFVDYAPMLAETGGRRREKSRQYRRFVEAGLARTDDEFHESLHESPRSIGSESFRAWIDELHLNLLQKQLNPQDITFRRMRGSVSAEEILAVVAEAFGIEHDDILRRQRNTAVRGVAAKLLCQYGEMTQRNVAGLLGLKRGAAVSYQIRTLKKKMSKDRKLSRLVVSLEKKMETMSSMTA